MSCNCGCGGCQTKIRGPLLIEGKVKSLLSEGLQYHIDKKIPLFETVYRIGSDKHLSLIKEARKMYSRNVIDLCEEDEALIKTHLGEFALYEGESVPLDLPMLEEQPDSKYPNFDLDKNIKYQDTSISSGMWRYTGKEQGGKGVYRNLNNDQFLGFSSDDFAFFKKHLGNHFDISESLSEVEIGDMVQIDSAYGGGKGKVEKKVGSFVVIKGESYHESDVKSLKEDAPGTYMLRVTNAMRNTGKGQESNNVPPFFMKHMKDAGNLKEKLKGYKLKESKEDLDEAEFKGKKVALGKPKRGGPKAYYVYVKDGDKVKKVTFGSGGLRAKIKNKEARNAFAARHNCKDKKDRTKAGYWSCNLPRYAPALGLGAKMNTFW